MIEIYLLKIIFFYLIYLIIFLNNNKIYKILRPDCAIGFIAKNYPIVTGHRKCGFYFSKGYILDDNLSGKFKIYDYEKNEYELTEQKNKFSELEIFEIL